MEVFVYDKSYARRVTQGHARTPPACVARPALDRGLAHQRRRSDGPRDMMAGAPCHIVRWRSRAADGLAVRCGGGGAVASSSSGA
jgi:hypothetical protein